MAKPGREATKKLGLAPKRERVSRMSSVLKEGQGFLLLNNLGMSLSEATALRAELRQNEVAYRVIKNTLLKRALEDTGYEVSQLEHLLKGPTVVAVGLQDPVVPAKVLDKFIEDHEGKLEFKGGYLEGRVLDQEAVQQLAKMPGREELLGRLVGSMSAPAQNLVYALNATVSKVVYAMDAYRRKLEEGA